MEKNLTDRVTIVTGGGSGIGRETCLEFARAGSLVAVCDVVMAAAEETASEVVKSGGKSRAYQVDVSELAAVEKACNTIAEDFGRIDVLVNNAGIARDNLIIRMSESDFDLVIAVNLKGAFNFSKACCRYMMKQRWGRIINISSVVGQMGNAGQTNYAAAKAGLIGFTKSLARELAARNITVNALAPGFIATAMTESLSETTREAYMSAIPLKRFGTAGDVAKACLFLSTEAAGYITGQVLRIDGGMVM